MLARYHEKFVVPLDENQVKGTQRPQQRDFIGKYTRSKSNPAITISVALDGEEGLKITINSHVNQSYILKHYYYDTWSLLPGSEEEASRRGYFVIFNSWEEYLVSFERRLDGAIGWLTWKLDGVVVRYERTM